MQAKRIGLTKIRAGLYRHDATGKLIVRTDGQYEGIGPRGGDQRGWEIAHDDPYGGFVIEGGCLYATLREAAEAVA